LIDDSTVFLTAKEHERIRAVAVERGISVEEAALQLSKEVIRRRFLLPSAQAQVLPFQGLKREPK
jgi:hypothetical protein